MNSINYHQIESIFRQFNQPIWIVTSANQSQRGGLVATWVFPASIDEQAPTVVIAIAANHFTAELIDLSKGFALHLISAEQIDLAWNFAIDSGRDRDKLADLNHEKTITGSPRLAECLAWLDCKVYSRMDGGDRVYYWADIIDSGEPQQGIPFREQELFAAANKKQREQLMTNRDLDINIQRPMKLSWRNNLPELLQP